MKKIGILTTITYTVCFGLNVESAMSYKLIKDVYAKPKTSPNPLDNIKGGKLAIKKAAAKDLRKPPMVKESSTIILQKPKSRLSNVSITPNFTNYNMGGIVNYDDLAQSFKGGEASIKINESSNIKIRNGSVNFTHTY